MIIDLFITFNRLEDDIHFSVDLDKTASELITILEKATQYTSHSRIGHRNDCLRLFHRIIDHSLIIINEMEPFFKERAFLVH